MVLSVLERLLVLNLLPFAKGDLTLLRVVREFEGAIGFTDEELQALQFTRNEKGTQWKDVVDPKEFVVEETIRQLLIDAITAKSDNKDLKLEEYDLYERLNAPKE